MVVVDVAAASDENRVDICGVIGVDADPATGNDKADTYTWSVGVEWVKLLQSVKNLTDPLVQTEFRLH